jgi:hypothetical protein
MLITIATSNQTVPVLHIGVYARHDSAFQARAAALSTHPAGPHHVRHAADRQAVGAAGEVSRIQ